MPKAERGTPKDIGNRIKAKGLQKLKFYCQMCEKQCRDANGFKCHLTSENHLRQMKIFSDHAGGILDKYSQNFERTFIATLKMRHGTKQVNANNVYQEVIQDKQHVHMNATHWTTLTEFVQYLGKTGKCIVEETERGWYISYIERDASILARQQALQQREQGERAAEAAQAKRMELQRIEAMKALDRAGGTMHLEPTKIMNNNEQDQNQQQQQAIKVNLANINTTNAAKKSNKRTNAITTTSVFGDDDDDDDNDDDDEEEEAAKHAPKIFLPTDPQKNNKDSNKRKDNDNHENNSRKRSREETTTTTTTNNSNNHHGNDTNDKRHESSSNNNNTKTRHEKDKKDNHKKDKKDNDDDNDAWLYRNILVRIISKSFGDGKYFKRKAIVDKVSKDNPFTATVEVLGKRDNHNDGDDDNTVAGNLLLMDQEDLETVIPKSIHEKVRILMGKYRGEKAIVESLNKERQEATLRLLLHNNNNKDDNKLLKHVPYEEFSKIG